MPYPFWALVIRSLARGDESAAFAAGVALAMVCTSFWVYTGEQIQFDSRSVSRIRGFPKRTVDWAEIERVTVYKGGIVLRPRRGKPLLISNRFLSGYPELAKQVIVRLPSEVLHASGGREILERQAALLESTSADST